MRHFKKGAEPRLLVKYRKEAHATYRGMRDDCKQDVRDALVRDQSALCAYCMGRVTPSVSGMRIEHWRPQSPNRKTQPKLELEWRNLLGVCQGGVSDEHGRYERDGQHCDRRKGERTLTLDPQGQEIERVIGYGTDGTIDAPDVARRAELNDVLNLNIINLRRNRAAALHAFHTACHRRKSGTWSDDEWQAELARVQTPDHGTLPEYVGVIEWWIRRRTGQKVYRPSGSPEMERAPAPSVQVKNTRAVKRPRRQP